MDIKNFEKFLLNNFLSLLSCHTLGWCSLELLGFLHYGTKTATPYADQVVEAAAFNPLLLPDLATDGDACPQVEEGDELGEGAHQAALTDLLGVLAVHVTWAEPGNDTCAAVVEAAKGSVGPLLAHFVM